MTKNSHLFASLLIVFWATSCQLKDAPPENSNNLVTTQTAQTCPFEGDVMEQFFLRDISPELQCLQKNLETYAKVNQVRDPGVIDERELAVFLKQFFKNPKNLEKGLKDFFTLAHFGLNAAPGKIPVNKIPSLFSLLKILNNHGRVIHHVMQDLKVGKDQLLESTYLLHRQELEAAVLKLSADVAALIKDQGDLNSAYQIHDLLKMDWAQKNTEMIEDIEALLFTKVVFLGGEPEIVSRAQLLEGLNKLPTILSTAYDLMAGRKVPFNSERSYALILQHSLKNFSSVIFHQEGGNEVYFSLAQLIAASHHFEQYALDLTPMADSLYNFYHTTLFRAQDEGVNHQSILMLLDYVDRALERVVRFSDLWSLNEALLKLPKIPLQNELAFPPVINELNQQDDDTFSRLVTTHHYFLGDSKIPNYGRLPNRDRRGVIELGLVDYGVRLFLSAHSPDPLRLSKEVFFQILLRYDDFVTEMKLWRNPLMKMVNSNFLMADLFRQVSTPDGLVDVEEIIGVTVMELTSFRMANELFPEVQAGCQADASCAYNEELEGVTPAYFYQRFFNYLATYRENFPEVYAHGMKLSLAEKSAYAQALGRFTRHCPFDGQPFEVPIRHKDLVLIFGGLISLEETYLLMDEDHDRILNFEELDNTAARFRNAIIDFAKLPPAQHLFARTIFFYLVVNQKMPAGPADLLAFQVKLALMNKSKINLDRSGVANLISFFSTPDPEPHPDCYKKISRPIEN